MAESVHRWAIDSIERDLARIEEDGTRMLSLPVHLLPKGVTEGQLLRVTRAPGIAAGSVVITIVPDPDATAMARETSRLQTDGAMKASRKRDPGGDVNF